MASEQAAIFRSVHAYALGIVVGWTASAQAEPSGAVGAASATAPAEPPGAVTVGAATATADEAALAQSFSDAVRLFKQGQIEQALAAFESVAQKSGSPNALLYVGHCLIKQKEYVKAHRAFADTVREIGKRSDDAYEQTREAAEGQLSWLSARVAKLVIAPSELPPGLAVKVDGEDLAPSSLGAELVFSPGVHVLEATADGVVPVRRTIDVGSGDRKTIAFGFKRAETSPSPARPSVVFPASGESARPPGRRGPEAYRTLGFAAGGLGIAGLTVFVVSGLNARATYESLGRDCPDGNCLEQHDAAVKRGKSQQMLANVGLAAGVVGTVAGGILLYLGSRQATRSQVSLAVASGRPYVTCRVRF